MLKVGDKVRVREDLEKLTTFVIVREEMARLKGREVEISWVKENWLDGIVRYGVKEDLGDWCWTEEMFERIEEKEGNNMKELTFREVITNIKEGEVWESEMLEIYLDNKTSELFLKHKTNYFNCREIGIKKEKKFKLKRPQYTFQEAFKAFEEGKEIESCVTSYTFRKIDDYIEVWDKTEGERRYLEFDEMFSLEEIRNKWYIND